MSIDKLQGLRVKIATVDEWLSGDIREDVIGALEQGAAKEQSGGSNDDYLIVAISSEGTVRNGSGDTIKMELMKILKGEYKAPHTSIWWYKLDSIDEVNDPDKWIKANPNLGKTVSYETYQLDVERAENNPAVRNDILAKRFGIPMEDTRIISHTKKLSLTGRESIGRCLVPWARIYPRRRFLLFHIFIPIIEWCFRNKNPKLHIRAHSEQTSHSNANQIQRIYERGQSHCYARKYS